MIRIIPLLLLVPLNRFRGGGLYADKLPTWMGHPRFLAAGIFFLIASVSGGWAFGALAAVSYLLWCLPPWGRWYTLGYAPMQDGPAGRRPTWFERLIEKWTDSMSEAFLWRQVLGFVPAAILLFCPLGALIAAVMIWVVYEFSWMVAPAGREIQMAELGAGAVWGVFLLWAQ